MIEKIEDNEVIRYFYEISNIPRRSGNEKKIAEYLEKFAQERNLRYEIDELYNAIIWKDASLGYEDKEGIILQSHTDMICEKRLEVEHDFEKEGLDLYIDGDFIKARGTTLGADNGIGIAIMLAILDDRTLEHPLIEAIFTTQEETTMQGAREISTEKIKSSRMICLDNMNEDELWIGCSASYSWKWSLLNQFNKLNDNYELVNVTLKQFMGGHSGRDIGKKRGNPIKYMGDFLKKLDEKFDIYIKKIDGGVRSNVIPIRCSCSFYVSKAEEEKIRKEFDAFKESILNIGLEHTEKIKIEFNTIDADDFLSLNKENTKLVIDVINELPSGPYYKEKDDVLLSSNIGNITTLDENIEINFSMRSNLEEKSEELIKKFEDIKNKYKLIELESVRMPGYEHKMNSNFIDLCKDIYIECFLKKPKLTKIHVGLEAGYFNEKISNLDFIAIAPNIYNAHSPEEKCSISSIEKVYDYILNILSRLD